MKILKLGPWEKTDRGRLRQFVYEHPLWFGPTEPGEVGEYRTIKCNETLMDLAWINDAGETVLRRGFVNTAPNVSYHSDLMRAAFK